MEYEILNQMIEEYSCQMKDPFRSVVSKIYVSIVLSGLNTLQDRIDKAREADIIAMSNEGCI